MQTKEYVTEIIIEQRANEKLWIEPILQNEKNLQNELRRLHDALDLFAQKSMSEDF